MGHTTVLHPIFQSFFGHRVDTAAPTYAAVRLLGLEAWTLHQCANVGTPVLWPQQGQREPEADPAGSAAPNET